MWFPARLAALTTLAVAATQAMPVLAQEPEERRTGIDRRDGRLFVSLGLQDLLRAQDAQRLLSGFTSRVLVRVAVVRPDSPEPVAQTIRQTEIVYDLWDEKFACADSRPAAR